MMPKYYYQIGEVANMLGVKTHTLRYWESEFPKLKPRKNKSGKRSYTLADIDILKKIKFLLYEQNFNIEGARTKMEAENLNDVSLPPKADLPRHEIKTKLKNKLEHIQDTIQLPPKIQAKTEQKKKIVKIISEINNLLNKKEEQGTWFPASSDPDILD